MKTLRERLDDAGYESTFILEGCDSAFLGITHNDRAVYDGSKILYDYTNVLTPEGMQEPLVVDKIEGEIPEGVVVLDPRGLDTAVLYIADDGRAVYGYDELIEAFMETENWDYEEACEWYSFNTERSLPYVDGSPYVLFNIDYLIEE